MTNEGYVPLLTIYPPEREPREALGIQASDDFLSPPSVGNYTTMYSA